MCYKSLYKAISCVEEYMQYFFFLLFFKQSTIPLQKALSTAKRAGIYYVKREKMAEGLTSLDTKQIVSSKNFFPLGNIFLK